MDKRTLKIVFAVVVVVIVVLYFSKEKKKTQNQNGTTPNNSSSFLDDIINVTPINVNVSTPVNTPGYTTNQLGAVEVKHGVGLSVNGDFYSYDAYNKDWILVGMAPDSMITGAVNYLKLGTITLRGGGKKVYSAENNRWISVVQGR